MHPYHYRSSLHPRFERPAPIVQIEEIAAVDRRIANAGAATISNSTLSGNSGYLRVAASTALW